MTGRKRQRGRAVAPGRAADRRTWPTWRRRLGRGLPDANPLWHLWVRTTAWVSSASPQQAQEAMAAPTRRTCRWRHRVWSGAWVMLLCLALVPWTLLGAVITRLVLPGWAENALIYGPLALVTLAAFYSLLRGAFEPPVPVFDERGDVIDTSNRYDRYIYAWIAPVILVLALIRLVRANG